MAGLIVGGNIANVERVKVVTEETTPKTYVFETASEADYEPAVSAGTEVEMRSKNAILGLLRTEDLIKGYDLTLTDQTLIPQILALVDGGTLTLASEELDTYAAPVAGTPVTRTPFTLTLYTSDRDSDGEPLGFHSWEFPHCKGKPIGNAFKENNFASMKYKLASRPAKGESPLTLTRIAALPAVV